MIMLYAINNNDMIEINKKNNSMFLFSIIGAPLLALAIKIIIISFIIYYISTEDTLFIQNKDFFEYEQIIDHNDKIKYQFILIGIFISLLFILYIIVILILLFLQKKQDISYNKKPELVISSSSTPDIVQNRDILFL